LLIWLFVVISLILILGRERKVPSVPLKRALSCLAVISAHGLLLVLWKDPVNFFSHCWEQRGVFGKIWVDVHIVIDRGVGLCLRKLPFNVRNNFGLLK
jgi:hypothetical protein